MNKKYYVYLILTDNGSYYCGYTDNLEKRFQKHINGKGAKYTRMHKPVEISWYKEFKTKSEAIKYENEIKKLSHRAKYNLAMTTNQIR